MPRPTPLRRRRVSAETANLSPEEQKQALIESYATRRASHGHGSRTAMYIGIVICAMVVVAGWALTTGRTLFAPFHPDPTVTAIANSAQIFQK
jgi:hypothetical protein